MCRDSDGDIEWSMPSTCCAQKHPFPIVSGKECCSPKAQRINLTDDFVMLEVRHDLKPRVLIIGRRGSNRYPRDSMTVLLTLACLQCQDHLTPNTEIIPPASKFHRRFLSLLPSSRKGSSTIFPVLEFLTIGTYSVFYTFIWTVLDCREIIFAT